MTDAPPRPETLLPRARAIVRATDLGAVRALKHLGLFVLADTFGDIRPDTRGLGLYDGDTRILSCAAIRIDGERPVVLRSDDGGGWRAVVELTNGDLRERPAARRSEITPNRESIGITRERWVDGRSFHERLVVSNFTLHEYTVPVELELDADFADIFEVRGLHREERGDLLPIDVGERRIRFAYAGIAGMTTSTDVEFDDPPTVRATGPDADGVLVASWTLVLAGGGRAELGWSVTPSYRSTPGWRGASGGRSEGGSADTREGRGGGEGGDGRARDAGVDRRETATVGDGLADALLGIVDATGPAGSHGAPGSPGPGAGRTDATPSGHGRSPIAPIVAQALAEQRAGGRRSPADDHADWWADGARIEADNELVELTLRRGIEDLRVLVNDGPLPGQWYVAAGVPWFSAFFGRDALITSLQTVPFYPAIAIATLEGLAAIQATADDPWRDAEPGKMPHELRTGELARADVLPFTPYYGSADATPLWLVLLAETFDWTGDSALVDRLWPNALAALRWIDDFGDLDGDGFVEYRRRSPLGLRNQGWKDSSDSIRDRFGGLAEPPIALAEVQGYVYDAKVRLARLARLRGDLGLADRLERDAAALRTRFEECFWLPDLGRYAMALDGGKRPADALGSVGGHLLWSGIANPDHAATIEEQLLGPALFNGWGVRTLAADAPGYNPLGYHVGTVWPHDTAIASAGLKRYGRHDGAARLAQSLLESAQYFAGYRLPELFCGFDRASTSVPVAYPTACSPQAWAAGAPFLLLRTLLGLEARADERELRIVNPILPPWIRRITIRNLGVGTGRVDLLFHRWRGMTAAELLGRDGQVGVTVRL